MSRTDLILLALAFASIAILNEVAIRFFRLKNDVYTWKIRIGSIAMMVVFVIYAFAK